MSNNISVHVTVYTLSETEPVLDGPFYPLSTLVLCENDELDHVLSENSIDIILKLWTFRILTTV